MRHGADSQELPRLSRGAYQEAISELEATPDISGFFDKVVLLATAEGLKPVSMVDLRPQKTEEEINQVRARVETLLSRLGLHFESKKLQKEGGLWFSVYWIAKDKKLSGKAMSLFLVEHHTPNQEAEIGTLMGYPSTSVEAYRKFAETGDPHFFLSHGEILKNLNSQEYRFLFFKLSRDHWKEEVSWLRELMGKVKELSPALYLKITSV